MAAITNNATRNIYRRLRMLQAELRNAQRMAVQPTAWAAVAQQEVSRLQAEIAETNFQLFYQLAAEKQAA